MKIYAIRDRMLDYFQQPFVGPNDNAVRASLAAHVNNPEATDAIAQAPHHFEIHQLGYVTEEGALVAEKSFICDCSSLIRVGLRERRPGGPGKDTDTAPDRRELNAAIPPKGEA